MNKEMIKALNSIHNIVKALLKESLILYVSSILFPEYITVNNFVSAIITMVMYSLIGLVLSIVVVVILDLFPGFSDDTAFMILLRRVISIACHMVAIAILSYNYAPFSIVNEFWAYFIFYYITSAELDTK